MATFDNLVAEAQPTAEVMVVEITEGDSWEFYAGAYVCLDDNGEYTEVNLAGVSAEWVILNEMDGTPLITLSTTILQNQVVGYATPEQTATLGDGFNPARTFPWYCVLTKGGRKVTAFGAHDSRLTIREKD